MTMLGCAGSSESGEPRQAEEGLAVATAPPAPSGASGVPGVSRTRADAGVRCGPGNCEGCCSGNTCILEVGDRACGTGGHACRSCGDDQRCLPRGPSGGVCGKR